MPSTSKSVQAVQDAEQREVGIFSEPKVVNHRGAMAFVLKAHAEMYAKGDTDRDSITGQEFAVFAMENAQVVGAILWELDEEDDTCRVALVAVAENTRRRGVFGMMWATMKECAADQGSKEVHCFVTKKNAAAIAAYEHVGLDLDAHYYTGKL